LTSTLGQELARLGVSLSSEIESKLSIYLKELEHWNRRMNLTSLVGRLLVKRLVVDPCWIGQQLQMSGTIVDLGSGNGSPGIPLYLGCKLERAHLVEARLKRSAFLRHVASCLKDENIVVHRFRLEDMPAAPAANWITLQGVKPVPSVIHALRRLFPSTTRVVWITSGDFPLPGSSGIFVPESNTVVRLIQLDQF